MVFAKSVKESGKGCQGRRDDGVVCLGVDRTVNELALRVYDVIAQPSALGDVLDEMVHALDAGGVSVTAVDARTETLHAAWGSDRIRDLYQGEDGRRLWQAEQPLLHTLVQKPGEYRFRSDESLADEHRRSTREAVELSEVQALLRESFGTQHREWSHLGACQDHHNTIQVHFGDLGGPSRARSLRLGAQLLPHLSKALIIGRPFANLEARYATVLDVLDRLQLGVIITGFDRRVWLSNEAARRLLERGDALLIDDSGRLGANAPEGTEVLDHAYSTMRTASGRSDALSMRVCFERAGISGRKSSERDRRCPIYVGDCSLVRHNDFGIGELGQGVLLVLSDPDAAPAMELATLEQLYGLTRSERSVCELLVRGFSNSEIADMRNVSSDTVASQVKALFAKTRCKKRGELIHLAHSVHIPIRNSP